MLYLDKETKKAIKRIYKLFDDVKLYNELLCEAIYGLQSNLNEPELARKYISDINYAITFLNDASRHIVKNGTIYFR